MKKAFVCALACVLSAGAMAQSPLMTLLNNGARPTSDLALEMMAGFVDCDAARALPRALAGSGAKLVQPGERFLFPDRHSQVPLVLEPDRTWQADGDHALGGTFHLDPPVDWPAGIQVVAVSQAVSVGPRSQEVNAFSVDAVTLTFNVGVERVIQELDRRYGGRITASLHSGRDHDSVWFGKTAGNALTCFRQSDLPESK